MYRSLHFAQQKTPSSIAQHSLARPLISLLIGKREQRAIKQEPPRVKMEAHRAVPPSVRPARVNNPSLASADQTEPHPSERERERARRELSSPYSTTNTASLLISFLFTHFHNEESINRKRGRSVLTGGVTYNSSRALSHD